MYFKELVNYSEPEHKSVIGSVMVILEEEEWGKLWKTLNSRLLSMELIQWKEKKSLKFC